MTSTLTRLSVAVAAAALAAILLSAPKARAQESEKQSEKQACVTAFETAQVLRKKHKLSDVKEQLPICSRPVCPALIRDECRQWSIDVARLMPSVLIAVRDENNRDVRAARLTIDGMVLADALAGKPVELDPGEHVVGVDAPGMVPLVESVVMREGERDRTITILLRPARSPTVAASPAPVEPVVAPEPDAPSRPVFPYVLAGAGVAALGGAIALDLSAAGDVRSMRESCAPTCAEGDVDAAKQKHYVALALGGVGIAAAGAGAFLLLTRPKSAPQGAGLQVAPTARGASVAWSARF